jgi:hypothetical protein
MNEVMVLHLYGGGPFFISIPAEDSRFLGRKHRVAGSLQYPQKALASAAESAGGMEFTSVVE